MDLQTFIHQVTGDWFTQKTVYDLAGATTESRKTNQSMVFLAPNDGAIVSLCEQCSVAAEQVWGALQTQWDSAKVDPYKSPEQGQALFVLLK
ncbi:MAG: phycobiliprotein lyase, partial [Spirulina sp. SIO3F2]|nr:phycobiliprotein lyase [Spirulina sp. SIO3F2]